MLGICCDALSMFPSAYGLIFQMSLNLQIIQEIVISKLRVSCQYCIKADRLAYLKLKPQMTTTVKPMVSAKHFFSENFGNRIFFRCSGLAH